MHVTNGFSNSLTASFVFLNAKIFLFKTYIKWQVFMKTDMLQVLLLQMSEQHVRLLGDEYSKFPRILFFVFFLSCEMPISN